MIRKKIYLLLTRFPDNGTKAIQALSGCYYPHTSIGLEEDMNTFYSFVSKGFIVESIIRYVKPGREPFPCQLYELEVSEKVYNRVKMILNSFVELRELMHYAKLGLILSLFHIPYKSSQFGYFCSQFVAEVLSRSGAVELKKRSNRYFSEELKRLPGMKLHFQGNLQTMIKHFGLIPSVA